MSSKVRWIPALVVSGAVLVAVPALVASARSTEAPVVPATAAVEPLLKVEGLQASTIAMADYQSTEQRERARQQVEERAREVRAREERARQAEIEKANSELLRVRQLVERGLASREQLIEAEKARAMAEGGRDEQRRAIVEWEAAARRFENLRALRELGLVNRDELARAENGLARLRAGSDEQKIAEALFAESIKEFERAKTLTDRGLMPKEQLRELEERFRQVQEQDRHRFERAEERMKQLYEELRPRREELEAVPSREIAAGDTLFISIEGESQLPTIYRIEGNGTIRVPLLGAFKVTGQTPGQVREAIGKKLMDSKLGSPAKVRVELRQPREERRVR